MQPNQAEGLAEHRLNNFELSMPGPTKESPADNIIKMLTEKKVSEAGILAIMTVWDGGTKMTIVRSRQGRAEELQGANINGSNFMGSRQTYSTGGIYSDMHGSA